MHLDSLECLDGTPYLLPQEPQAKAEMQKLLDRERRAVARLSDIRSRLEQRNLLTQTRQFQTAREIYESNSIEGLGPDLRGTWNILGSEHSRGLLAQFDQEMFLDAITQDEDVRVVLGLAGAKLLAERLRLDLAEGRQLTESDLRQIHATICAGESNAGAYKRWHVRISGEDAHEPILPIDVSPAMHALVSWYGRDDNCPTTLRAAIAHAWLTHIHPFEDGNGRLARILANITLAEGGLPPAIVKNASQRGAYLDALRHSDDGGDILPLTALFLGTVQRYIREIDSPRFLRRVFLAEIEKRGFSTYELWKGEFEEFITQFNAHLLQSGVRVKPLGGLDAEAFQYLKQLDATGNAWLQFVSRDGGGELLMWFGYASSRLRELLGKGYSYPSINFSVRNARHSMRPFRRVEPLGLSEVTIAPGFPTHVYALRGDRLRSGAIADAAAEIAEVISDHVRIAVESASM